MSHENGRRRKERRIVICKVKLELWREASEVTTLWLTPICCKQTSHRVHSRRKSLEKVIIRRCWLFPHETKLSNREHFRNPHLMRQSDDEWEIQCKPNLSFLCVCWFRRLQNCTVSSDFPHSFSTLAISNAIYFQLPPGEIRCFEGESLESRKIPSSNSPKSINQPQHWNVAHNENCNAKSSSWCHDDLENFIFFFTVIVCWWLLWKMKTFVCTRDCLCTAQHYLFLWWNSFAIDHSSKKNNWAYYWHRNWASRWDVEKIERSIAVRTLTILFFHLQRTFV